MHLGRVAVVRVRWVIALALFLLAVIAVPVTGAPADQIEIPASVGPLAPSAAEVAEIEADEREREEWLAGSEATHQREASRTA